MKLPFRRFDPRLAAELQTQRRPIFLGLICVAIAAGLQVCMVQLTKVSLQAIGQASAKDAHAVAELGYIGLAVVLVYALRYWFVRGQTYFLSEAAAKLAGNMRVRLFDKLQRLPISYFNSKRSGDIQSVLTNDVGVYQTAVAIIRDSIDAPIKGIGAAVYVFIMNWQLGLISLAFLPVMFVVIQRNGRKMRARQLIVQRDLGNLTAMSQEALQGIRVIKAFNAERTMSERHAAYVRTWFTSQMRAVRTLASLRPLVEFIGAFAVAAVVYLCGWMAFHGRLQVADLGALLLALDIVNQGFRSYGSVNNTYGQVQAASQRIYDEILNVPEPRDDGPTAKTLENPTGRLEFRNVGFTYPDGTPALKNVSFVLEPGTSLALVGPSGAGKSTIADLVLRFYDPTEGQILFDGVDARELKASHVRSQIGVVPQETFLFAGSIRDNILLGSPGAGEEEMRAAAEAAHVGAFVDLIPEGYDTELGERGVRVSGGEMQRIAIARALVRKPTLLLLDEATSNLDAVSEKAVQGALDEIMKQRTTLFIAHRLTTAARADRIAMMRKGELIECGSHKELMERGGAYAAMYFAFSSGVLDDALV